MNIILFGPPGAGKGTQANNLVKKFNLYKISTGDLLRDKIKDNNELNNKIKSLLKKGSLISDDIINDLIQKIISDKKYSNRLIFDGYPRNLNQAKKLDLLLMKYNQKISCVLSLTVDKKSIIKRILGRQICIKCGLIFNEYYKPATSINHSCDKKFLTKRSDDNEKTIIKRFDTYLEKTLPILDFYKEEKLLHQIDGVAKIDQIYKQIQDIIASLETWLCKPYLYK